jgi:hypothetical protein
VDEDSVVALPRPGASVTDDPLLAVLRDGARRMLMQAIEAEVEAFLAAHAGLLDQQGRRRLVRNGHAPERQIQTGIGPRAMVNVGVRGSGGDLLLGSLHGLTVAEADALDHLGQPLRAVQPAPAALGGLGELVDHRQGRLP